MSDNQNSQQLQNEQQIQLEKLNQNEVEIIYRIYQDMTYVFGVLFEYKALKDSKCDNSQLLDIYKNRCILQLNLSNAINFDDCETSKARQNETKYTQMKNAAASTYSILKHNLAQDFQFIFDDQELQEFFNHYEQINLTSTPFLKQQIPNPIDRNVNFNSELLSKIIQSINLADSERQQQFQNYQQNSDVIKEIMNPDIIAEKIKQRYQQAVEKIKPFENYFQMVLLEEFSKQSEILATFGENEKKHNLLRDIIFLLNLVKDILQEQKEQIQQSIQTIQKKIKSEKTTLIEWVLNELTKSLNNKSDLKIILDDNKNKYNKEFENLNENYINYMKQTQQTSLESINQLLIYYKSNESNLLNQDSSNLPQIQLQQRIFLYLHCLHHDLKILLLNFENNDFRERQRIKVEDINKELLRMKSELEKLKY